MILNELWEKFLKLVSSEVGHQVVDTWLKSVVLLKVENNKDLYFSVPNQFVNAWIKKNYIHLFKEHFPALLENANPELNFEFKVTANLSSSSDSTSIALSAKDATIQPEVCKKQKPIKTNRVLVRTQAPLKKKSLLSEKYSFKNFVVGPHNHLAYSAAQAVSKSCNKRYNPLFIYGKTGLGKTHLLHCIGNEFQQSNPDSNLIYKSSASFVNEFILAIRQGKSQSFTDRYKKIDLLLIDDIQFFAQKEQTQEAFFHIFNQMYDEKKQIVLTSDTMPQQLSGFSERLVSRFSWGLSTDITVPTLETRTAILLKKAEDLKIELSLDVANYIASNIITNVRELEGALTKLAAMTMLTFKPISLEMAQKELRYNSNAATKITTIESRPDFIVNLVLKHFRVTMEELKSKKRNADIVIARQFAAYLLKKHTNSSLRMIGYYLGGQTHSTILHGISKIKSEQTEDPFLKKVENILS